MGNWLKNLRPLTKSMRNSTQLKGLRSHFKSSSFWSYDMQHVARGVAAGLAGSVIPGFQIFYAAILIILLRGNLPIALLCTLITNPFTVIPISYFIYLVGSFVLRKEAGSFVVKSFQWDFSSAHGFWLNVETWILQFGKAFLIGLPIVSLFLGIIGYFGTLLIWNMFSLFFSKRKK